MSLLPRSPRKLLLAGVLATAVLACHRATGPLTFRGWRAGLPLDSARVLARRDAGKELTCITIVPAESFCTVSSERVYAHIFLTSDGQRTESVQFSRQIPPELPRDSLRAGLLGAWGQPDSTTAHREREPAMMEGVSVEWFGHWNSGTDYAFAYEINSPSTGRTLRVTLANRDALLAREERYGLRIPSRDHFKP